MTLRRFLWEVIGPIVFIGLLSLAFAHLFNFIDIATKGGLS